MKNQKKLALVLSVGLGLNVLAGCTTSEPVFQSATIESGEWVSSLNTDKAAYAPGDKVKFTLTLQEKVKEGSLLIQYKHLDDQVEEQEVTLSDSQEVTWEWTPEKEDFKGYMAEVYVKDGKDVVDHQNIAVDVSSDWSKFPRYGYLADFFEMEEGEQEAIIDKLNRFHLNGIQFYDWQFKHEKPLKMENGEVAQTWPDIANREVSKKTIENYIELAHEKNMKAMNYNLLFGSYENFEEEGVKKEWGIFRDPDMDDQDKHPLPENWASDIYLMDPSNEGWQEHLINAEKEVFDHLDFDGWHVDQLGDRGVLWNGQGKTIDLAQTYVPFLQRAKAELDVDFVMNAVSQYAQGYIASQAPVNFLYSELWDGHTTYDSLKKVIDQNLKYSKGELNTVLAAYMNYDLSNSKGEFNAPGVLLTNSVIFASGGAHLELGENMLSKEYFPHKNLEITDELNDQLTSYYDFTVAYENLLRDGAEEVEKEVSIEGQEVTASPELGALWSFVKKKDKQEIIQLINFTDAASMEWRDNDGSQPEPSVKEELKVTLKTDGDVDKVWTASPDLYEGSAMELEFKQKGDSLQFTLPSIKYWDMVVLEYK
ncbi:glycoside hydrolase family 66 protein [Rossellomorea vietnamensis]|uniref:glycoside hydrolase family 66 protein n=1 Tax=Rossellomorea vietnamensis TaxID=218284 RepID=UPI003CF913A5